MRARYIQKDDDGNPVRIFIDEHLTPMRARFCKKLREEKVQHHTWDGQIFITKEGEGNGNRLVVDTPDDWERFDIPVSVKEEIGIFPKM